MAFPLVVSRISRALLALMLVIAVVLTADAVAVGPGGWDHLGDAGIPGSDSLNGTASALHPTAGALYVGGIFTDAGGNADADRIATWNGSTWGAVSSAASGIDNGSVNAIAVAEGKVYAGGTFVNAGGDANADFLAVWDGVAWGPVCDAAGPAFAGNVEALQVIGPTLYVGGTFQDAAGFAAADYLIACDLGDGTAGPTTTDPAHPFSGPVHALAASPGGVLYAGGRFGDLENIAAADNIAYLDAGGWHAMGSGAGPCGCVIDGFVRSLAVEGSDVFVGTDVKDVDGIAKADNVVKWDGFSWGAVGANGAGIDGWFPATTSVYGMAAFDGNVVATGSFQNADGNPLADNIAAFAAGAWHPVGSDGAGNGPWIGDGLEVAVFDGRLFAAGGFTSAGGDPQARGVASRPLPVVATPVATPTVTAGPPPVPTPTVTAAPGPVVTIDSGPKDGAVIRDSTPTFTFGAAGLVDEFTCFDETKVSASFVIGACTSPHTLSARADGDYAFYVRGAGPSGIGPAVQSDYTVDTKKPAPRLRGALIQAAGPVVGVSVACGDEACRAVASGTVDVPGASRVYRLRRTARRIPAGRKVRLRLGVPKKARRAIRAALSHGSSVTAHIAVRATDRAGNARTRRRSVTLTR